MLTTRFAHVLSLSAAIVLLGTSPGCVVAIGNRGDGERVDGLPRRIRLTDTERRDLPTVTSVADLPTVRSMYGRQIASLSPSTTPDELRAMMPVARFVERREVGTSVIDAYSVSIHERYRYRGESYGLEARDEMWFYFRDGLLVKQGAPHNWP